jgi:hypothetical protein
VRDRVAIRVVARAGKPAIDVRATRHAAIVDALALLDDLAIHIPARCAVLAEIRGALPGALIDPAITRPIKHEHDSVDLSDCFDCFELVSELPCDLPDCDVPCDLPCDL